MPRILVKAAPGLAVSRLSFGAAPVKFKATRLFESIEAQPAPAAGAGEVWHILTPPVGFRRGQWLGRLSFAVAAWFWRGRRTCARIRRT